MTHPETHTFTAFLGHTLLATGQLTEVATMAKERLDAGASEALALFDDETGRAIDLDLRGTVAEVIARLGAGEAGPVDDARRGPGRPKLGVVSREVSLLPRHWEWLGLQPGGASAALRRLVEDARRNGGSRERARQARDATYRFMSAMAGDFPLFEEASRALYAKDYERFQSLIAAWPEGVRTHLLRLLDRTIQSEWAAADAQGSHS
jgi:hypothetical protein